MKALLMCVAWIAAATATVVQADSAPTETELKAVQALVHERFPRIAPESVKRSDVPGMFEIQQGVLVAYISTDGRYLVQGNVIDLETDVNITEQSIATGRRDFMSGLDVEGIVFAPRDAKHMVTVFTDIDCTFCRKLHREIASYNDAGIAVRYLMYPRSGPNTRSWEKAEEVWCASDQRDAMTRAKNDQTLPSAECDASAINDHFQAGLGIGLSGTPAIVLEDGTLISGYLPAAELLSEIEGPASDSGDR
ncbi:MAG: DsbC family protein [Pseudomonadota bacterium]